MSRRSACRSSLPRVEFVSYSRTMKCMNWYEELLTTSEAVIVTLCWTVALASPASAQTQTPDFPTRRQRIALLTVGSYLWIMMILLGSIMLETFMVYPNVFYNPPDSLRAGLEFMKVRTPHDFYPPLGFFSWVLGTASLAAAWP